VGDAAHTCHPVGGQGLNLGIRDAAALAEVLTTPHQAGQDIGDLKVLQQYQRWRRRQNWLALGFTDILNRVFSSRWFVVVIGRRLGLRLLRWIAPLRVRVLRFMAGLSGRSPDLAQPKPIISSRR